MKLGYDGTIRFDTRIDTAGVNEGIAKIGNSLKGAGKAFLGFGKSVGKVLAGIGKALTIGIIVLIVAAVAAIAGLIRLISSAGKAAASAGEDVLQQARKLEELKQTFAELKNAITDAFRPLILAAMPWITTVTNAVIRLLNLIAQVIASLTGQEGYWKTVEADEAARLEIDENRMFIVWKAPLDFGANGINEFNISSIGILYTEDRVIFIANEDQITFASREFRRALS